MNVAVCTIVHGRHAHLRNQRHALVTSEQPGQLHVVVSMADPGVGAVLDDTAYCAARTEWRDLPAPDGLPLAAARNEAARLAIAGGAEVLVFLDVDCLPEPGLLGSYAAAVDSRAGADPGRPAVWCGGSTDLPSMPGSATYPVADPQALRAMSVPRTGRPVLPVGQVLREDDLTTFWSLNFALAPSDWVAIGGFDEAYVGYGGEDTDFAQRLGRADGHLVWLGGAVAHHQWHGTQRPPVDHLDDIVRNANLFHDRWGWWPMGGWLEAFADRGLAGVDDRGRWRVTGVPSGPRTVLPR